MAKALDDLHDERNDADYELDLTKFKEPNCAILSCLKAKHAYQQFQNLTSSKNKRKKIAIGIREYQKKVQKINYPSNMPSAKIVPIPLIRQPQSSTNCRNLVMFTWPSTICLVGMSVLWWMLIKQPDIFEPCGMVSMSGVFPLLPGCTFVEWRLGTILQVQGGVLSR